LKIKVNFAESIMPYIEKIWADYLKRLGLKPKIKKRAKKWKC
jgi:protoporphyrinogen oxidase